MRPEYIKELIDARNAYDRAFTRVFGRLDTESVNLQTSTELMEVAKALNAPIKSLEGPEGHHHGLYCYSGGVVFALWGRRGAGEVE